MIKPVKRLFVIGLVVFSFWAGCLLSQRVMLREQMIRLHVVANSDMPMDQQAKLAVRDAVLTSLRQALIHVSDIQEAKRYMQTNLPKIKRAAEEALNAIGCSDEINVTFSKAGFSETRNGILRFPSGIYDALRVTIGEGTGHNWWGVVFPSLSIPTVMDKGNDVAVSAVVPEEMSHTLTDNGSFSIGFFLLDAMGKLENFLYSNE